MAFDSFDNGRDNRPMMSDINVTPMVDVMLVLLIIFMVAAPMMAQGLQVDLPKVDSTIMRTDNTMVVLSVTATGQVDLEGNTLAGIENLDVQVREVMKTKNATNVYIKADQNVPYGRIALIMSTLMKAGITSVGLVTEPVDLTRTNS
ncbi:MAG: ExbD/TolR family protein [Deltaproteobacteria bacterium]|jgi:biopolymer transport protein TolR|nr:ExbD/TolR family protein [Deltaproteobacteria bacterium]